MSKKRVYSYYECQATSSLRQQQAREGGSARCFCLAPHTTHYSHALLSLTHSLTHAAHALHLHYIENFSVITLFAVPLLPPSHSSPPSLTVAMSKASGGDKTALVISKFFNVSTQSVSQSLTHSLTPIHSFNQNSPLTTTHFLCLFFPRSDMAISSNCPTRSEQTAGRGPWHLPPHTASVVARGVTVVTILAAMCPCLRLCPSRNPPLW